MYGEKSGPVVAIEYRKYKSGWKPISVVSGRDYYDFDWCEQDNELAYHLSGGGGDTGKIYPLARFVDAPSLCAKLWYDHARCKLTYDDNSISDKETRKLGYQIVADPIGGNPFEDNDAVEDSVEYCCQCRDYHTSDRMCRHVQYAEKCSGFCLGCGAPEIDYRKTQASLYRLLRMLSKNDIKTMIRITMSGNGFGTNGRTLLESFDNELNYEERYWPGIAWMVSLDKTCKEALALTAGWLWMFQRDSWRACCIVPEHQFIKHLSMRDLDAWLALDPLDARQLHNRPLRVSLGFKPQCANDVTFLANPEQCHEVTLWPPRGSKSVGYLGLTLSVADVKRVAKNSVDIYFGSVIERNGKHVSEMDGYDKRII